MSKLNMYRFYFSENTFIDVAAATRSGAEKIFVRRYGMRKLLNLNYIERIGGVSNV